MRRLEKLAERKATLTCDIAAHNANIKTLEQKAHAFTQKVR